ncbi:MAG TPA: DUF305 domain-containing protein [Nocardioides sp.]|nr:DUF305 domain-containing protein [Nocardioides sp.]
MAVAACALLAATGCSSDTEDPPPESDAPVVQLGAPGESNETLSSEEVEELDEPEHTAADVMFVQMMIPHHQRALEMTAMVEERTASERLPLLAERIEVSQTDEIAQLETWLADRGEPVSGDHSHHGDHGGDGGHAGLMPGMLTQAELATLRAADGRRFDRLFLQYMIRHHEGAVGMVEDLFAEGGGQESQVFQLASGIESDQLVEISRMEQMLVDGSY